MVRKKVLIPEIEGAMRLAQVLQKRDYRKPNGIQHGIKGNVASLDVYFPSNMS
jgi:hypothetical protein